MSWSALDYSGEEAVKKTFKVQFQTDDVTNDFRDIFAQGKVTKQKSYCLAMAQE